MSWLLLIIFQANLSKFRHPQQILPSSTNCVIHWCSWVVYFANKMVKIRLLPKGSCSYSCTISGGDLGDNCIQNFHLGRYIIGYTVENLVLR